MLITNPSHLSVAQTIQQIKAKLQSKNIDIFAEIDHAQAARKHHLELRDEVVLIFGNPTVGTYLMQENPTIGIDLPLKILVWQDLNNKTQITYLDPIKIGERHSIQKHIDILQNMAALLAQITIYDNT